MVTAVADARRIVEQVTDPEIPVLTIADLGVLRDVVESGDGVIVTITPTYSGCPAMDAIRSDIRSALAEGGYQRVEIRTVYAPAWTTDWMSEEGKAKLARYGIAPPRRLIDVESSPVLCPRCRSAESRTVSDFGSTACKALLVCESCREPFDHFKEL